LTLSQRTIEAHISHIMDKLAVSSRAQIAVWASDRLLEKPPGNDSRQKPSTRRKKNQGFTPMPERSARDRVWKVQALVC